MVGVVGAEEDGVGLASMPWCCVLPLCNGAVREGTGHILVAGTREKVGAACDLRDIRRHRRRSQHFRAGRHPCHSQT